MATCEEFAPARSISYSLIKETLWAFGGTGPAQRAKRSLNEVEPPKPLHRKWTLARQRPIGRAQELSGRSQWPIGTGTVERSRYRLLPIPYMHVARRMEGTGRAIFPTPEAELSTTPLPTFPIPGGMTPQAKEMKGAELRT